MSIDFEYKAGGIKDTGLRLTCDKSHFESESVGLRAGHGVQLSTTVLNTVELCTNASQLYGFTLQTVKDFDGGAAPGWRPPAFAVTAQLNTEPVGIGLGSGVVSTSMVLPNTSIVASGTYSASSVTQGDYVKFNTVYSLLQHTGTNSTGAIGQIVTVGSTGYTDSANKAHPGAFLKIRMFPF